MTTNASLRIDWKVWSTDCVPDDYLIFGRQISATLSSAGT